MLKNVKKRRKFKNVTDGRTDGLTDQPTDLPTYRPTRQGVESRAHD